MNVGTASEKSRAHELEIVDDASGRESAPSADSSAQVVLFGQKRPVTTRAIMAPVNIAFDGSVGMYALRGWGNQFWFPGANHAGVDWVNGPVAFLDHEVNPFGTVLLGCGQRDGHRALFNPGPEGRTEAELSIAARVVHHVDPQGDEDRKFLRLLVKDAIESRVIPHRLPKMRLSRIIRLHPHFGVDPNALLAWNLLAFNSARKQCRLNLALKSPPDEYSLSGCLEGWRKGRPDLPGEVMDAMREYAATSERMMRDSPTELAALCHAHQVAGLRIERTMAWLTPAFDAVADNILGLDREVERLSGMNATKVNAAKGDKKKQFNLLAVRDSTWHTANAAWELDYDMVLAYRSDGRFAIFMDTHRTHGWSPVAVVRLIRFIVLANDPQVGFREAHRRARDGELDAPGKVPGVEGLDYIAEKKAIVNGTKLHWAPDLRIAFEQLLELLKSGFDEKLSQKLGLELLMKYVRKDRGIRRVLEDESGLFS